MRNENDSFLKHIENTIKALEQTKHQKEKTKQELDKEIKLLNDQVEILKNSANILFPALTESNKHSANKQALQQVRDQRILAVIDFMQSKGGRDVHVKEIGLHLNLSRMGTRNWMNRIAQKPNSPWRHSVDQSTYSLTA